MHIGSNPTLTKPYKSHTILPAILNPKFEKKSDMKLGGFQSMEDQILRLFMNVSGDRGREYLGYLIHGESLALTRSPEERTRRRRRLAAELLCMLGQ
jgi:hypothetical protein